MGASLFNFGIERAIYNKTVNSNIRISIPISLKIFILFLALLLINCHRFNPCINIFNIYKITKIELNNKVGKIIHLMNFSAIALNITTLTFRRCVVPQRQHTLRIAIAIFILFSQDLNYLEIVSICYPPHPPENQFSVS